MKGIKLNTVLYYLERWFPYLFGVIVVWYLWKCDENYIGNSHLYDALSGVLTITGLIIGFLGAIMPVIIGMKNESKFIKYIFKYDNNKLFFKYIKETVAGGLLSAILTICMYFNENFKKYGEHVFYIWVYFVFVFFALTYRSIKYMLELFFSDDNDMKMGKTIDTEESDSQKEVMKKLNKDI